MIQVIYETFNSFGENTYLLYDETLECVIIDPGCYTENEKRRFDKLIEKNNLKPVKLLNTHCHIDHIFGNAHVNRKYQLPVSSHPNEQQVMDGASRWANTVGIDFEKSPNITHFLNENDTVTFGNSTLNVLFTPGHSPASISFYCPQSQFVIAGDVLFRGSIGRYDLPGGDFNTLINSIKTQLLTLPPQTKVYSGHGQPTTIGYEIQHNPFLQK